MLACGLPYVLEPEPAVEEPPPNPLPAPEPLPAPDPLPDPLLVEFVNAD